MYFERVIVYFSQCDVHVKNCQPDETIVTDRGHSKNLTRGNYCNLKGPIPSLKNEKRPGPKE